MDKMVILVYRSADEKEITHCVSECDIAGYTKIPKVYGKGKTGGARFGTHVWPGENEMMIVSSEELRIQDLLEMIKEKKSQNRIKGIKAFVLPVEQVL
ncbi:hypothetical protein DRQ07_09570 [candidate division KSB1 bacterium]|nr:MAG: hypothetical protein DRQ07_09570 [candidate division KSB1 bacterium]